MVELTGFTKIFAAFGVPGLVIGIVYVMLYFFTERIGKVPPGDAAKVLIVVILVTGGLTYVSIDRVFPPPMPAPGPGPVVQPAPDRDLRFQTRYVETKFYPLDAGKVRADFTVRFVPTIKGNGHLATVFLGMAKIHNNAKVHDIDAFRRDDKKCADSASCIAPPVVWMGRQTVRGEPTELDHEFSAVLNPGVKQAAGLLGALPARRRQRRAGAKPT